MVEYGPLRQLSRPGHTRRSVVTSSIRVNFAKDMVKCVICDHGIGIVPKSKGGILTSNSRDLRLGAFLNILKMAVMLFMEC